jgi:hypothetical protein
MIKIKLLRKDGSIDMKEAHKLADVTRSKADDYPLSDVMKAKWKLPSGDLIMENGRTKPSYYVQTGSPPMAKILYNGFIEKGLFPNSAEFQKAVMKDYTKSEDKYYSMIKSVGVKYDRETARRLCKWRACGFLNSKLKEIGIALAIHLLISNRRVKFMWTCTQDLSGKDIVVRYGDAELSNINVSAGRGGKITSEVRVLDRDDIKAVRFNHDRGKGFHERVGSWDMRPRLNLAVGLHGRRTITLKEYISVLKNEIRKLHNK